MIQNFAVSCNFFDGEVGAIDLNRPRRGDTCVAGGSGEPPLPVETEDEFDPNGL